MPDPPQCRLATSRQARILRGPAIRFEGGACLREIARAENSRARKHGREGDMKHLLVALLCCWSSQALAQTAQELIDSGKNSENVTTFGMGYHLNQYSPLSQINKSNVKRLVPIWSTSLSNDAGELAQPTIYNGVMYVVNGHWTFARRSEERRGG